MDRRNFSVSSILLIATVLATLLSGTEGQCTPNLLNCANCTADKTTCYQCSGNMYGVDSNGKCQPCSSQVPSGCAYCTTMSRCDQCSLFSQAPYSNQPGCGDCSAHCSNCTVSGPGLCDVCSPGYFLQSGVCQACTTVNCSYCPNDVCTVCQTGSVINSGSCSKCADNCKVCSAAGAGKCNPVGGCKSGYGIVTTDGTCAPCIVGNCDVCSNSSSTTCQTCMNRYYPNADNTTCTHTCKEIANCDNCLSNPTICNKCTEPYGVNVTDRPNRCYDCRLQENCSRCDNVTYCTRCRYLDTQGPRLDNTGTCGLCASNCFSCTNNGADKCDKCNDGYNLNAGKTCDPCTVQNCAKCATNTSICDSCLEGFVKSATLNLCDVCASNCNYCNTNGAGKCDSQYYCHDGYQFNSTTMLCDASSTTASPTTTGAPTTATPPCNVQYCSTCFNTTACQKCQDGYGVTSNLLCAVCSTRSGCSKCDNLTLCTQCTDYDYTGPYKDGSGACGPCASDCLECPINGAGQCDVCNAGFFLNATKQCQPCTVSHCMECPNNECVRCTSLYVLSAGICEPCGQFCNLCTLNGPGKCNVGSCQPGYPYDAATKTCRDPSATTPFVSSTSHSPASTSAAPTQATKINTGEQTTGPLHSSSSSATIDHDTTSLHSVTSPASPSTTTENPSQTTTPNTASTHSSETMTSNTRGNTITEEKETSEQISLEQESITSTVNTNPANSSPVNTNPVSSSPANTNPLNTNPQNTGPEITNPANTSPQNTITDLDDGATDLENSTSPHNQSSSAQIGTSTEPSLESTTSAKAVVGLETSVKLDSTTAPAPIGVTTPESQTSPILEQQTSTTTTTSTSTVTVTATTEALSTTTGGFASTNTIIIGAVVVSVGGVVALCGLAYACTKLGSSAPSLGMPGSMPSMGVPFSRLPMGYGPRPMPIGRAMPVYRPVNYGYRGLRPPNRLAYRWSPNYGGYFY